MQRWVDLLRFDGRLSRLGYWRAYLALAIASAVVWCLGLLVMLSVGPIGGILLLPILPIIVASAAIIVRRLHDRGKSGWWACLFLIFPTLVSLDRAAETPGATPPAWFTLLSLAMLALSIWGLIEIGFRRGTPGPNRYGELPIDLPQAALARK